MNEPETNKPTPEVKPISTGSLVVIGTALFLFLYFGGCGGGSDKPKKAECFSAWDGSHPALVRAVKKQLNDPESFEHLETSTIDKGDYYIVIMKFTAKNGFGGRVTNTATVQCGKDCTLAGAPVIL